ncbi:C2H2-type zinc finger-containing protein [Cavenderia fasciculata]|uniref:C2H2-type zinc finger-containing protein n=1 Tax=Cavenderia fasciculata TaxID=261658 RepID=F4QDK7_CACFS|nr:C2H2-type zinc finger-containing protein [Cavenderia fasciculata]EGG13804.1 C2H2-type zinc finger-containing protein [Cavenderia fasciculata]|eukprot:XP_004350512.1 C2H2-type zinc finger-containing protein [Cavenderia fasciculata]
MDTQQQQEQGEQFTCISCRVLFDTVEDQRVHYKSELHRFNLKRKVLDLPPVTYETFLAKVEAAKKEEEKAATAEPTKFECRFCNKSFSSEGPYKQHIDSKKHKDIVASGATEKKVRVKKPMTDEEKEKIANETQEEYEAKIAEKIKNTPKLPIEHCLFCTKVCKSLDNNVKHMAKVHSFFIPDIEYLVDLEGLIRFCSDKINVGNICLYCNGRGRKIHTLEAVQQHMVDLSHCKMNYETEEDSEEYLEYYDFSKSYADPSNPDEEINQDNIKNKIIVSDHELVLPDGTTIGHRDYAKYYKQRYTTPDKRQEAIHSVIRRYKALGWTDEPKNNFSEMYKQDMNRKRILDLKIGIKKNNQRHFTLQLLIQ